MPFSRRLPRIAPTGRVSLRLTPMQRDLMLTAPGVPREIGHALHRATVRAGKLQVRLDRNAIETMIRALAAVAVPDSAVDRSVRALLDYLESVEDRFAGESAEDPE
jgi:hypothetical protein